MRQWDSLWFVIVSGVTCWHFYTEASGVSHWLSSLRVIFNQGEWLEPLVDKANKPIAEIRQRSEYTGERPGISHASSPFVFSSSPSVVRAPVQLPRLYQHSSQSQCFPQWHRSTHRCGYCQSAVETLTMYRLWFHCQWLIWPCGFCHCLSKTWE